MQKGGRQGSYWDSLGRNKDEILNVRERAGREQSGLQRAISRLGGVLSSPAFFVIVLLLHVGWVVLNHPAASPIEPFDPPPYTLLATIASVEAPLLSLLILMRQERDRKIAELREETALQVDLHTERETSALIALVTALCRRLEVSTEVDPEHLEAMREPLQAKHLFEEVREHLGQVEEEEGDDREPGRKPGRNPK